MWAVRFGGAATFLAGATVLLWSGAASVRAQLSPGPLAEPHRELDSPLKCTRCHEGGARSMDGRCLDCHREIRKLIQQGHGFHGREAKERCASCHPDHAGRDFEMIRWDKPGPDAFDHARAGWPLAGKHAGTPCRDCHKAEFQRKDAGRPKGSGKPRETWLLLDTACVSCHQDHHRGALGQDCKTCHDETAWKPAPRFDHGKTSFALTGQHAVVTCEKCHVGEPVPIYKPVPHQECSACHADPHKGQLGPGCAKCHTTEGFRKVARGSFDHDRTRYPLRGAHAALKCESCHDPRTAWGKKPVSSTCGACHQDAHAGQATLAGKPVDCASCHDVAGFRPSTYTVDRHAASAYPLLGRHREVPCASCHAKDPRGSAPGSLGKAGVRIRPAHARCRDCHEDSHGGQVSAGRYRGECEPCHRVEGWRPATFTAAEHAALRLPLQGRHAEIPCADCHGPKRKGLPPLPGPAVLGKAGVAIVLKDPSCAACHVDPHGGRFTPKGDCLACHGYASFRPSLVDIDLHRKLGWPLDGAHRAVPCIACHEEMKSPRAVSTLVSSGARSAPLRFSSKRERCESCHETPHGDQFAGRRDRGACDGCHGADSFRPATRFDHDRDASFALTGAHRNVVCERCHTKRRLADGRDQVTYRPVPIWCESCHGKTVPAGGKG